MRSKLEIVEEKAKELISLHTSNKNIPCGWKFAFNNRSVHVGLCSYSKRTIFLSKKWAEILSIEKSIDTILHEIAHAMTPDAHHGPVWKAACVKIGANPNRVADVNEEELKEFDLANLSKYAIIHKPIDGEVEVIKQVRRIGSPLFGSYLKGRPGTKGKLYYVEVKHLTSPDIMQYAFKASEKVMKDLEGGL